MAVVNEVSTVSHIPQFVPFGLLYYTQDTGDLYIGTGFSTGSDYVGGNPGPNVNVELISSPGGLPGGFNGDIQYNNNGNLGGSAATITAAGAINALSITATSATIGALTATAENIVTSTITSAFITTATVTSTLELQTATIVDSLGSTGTVGQALESTGTGVKWAAVSSTETWAALTGAMTATQVAPWYNATSTIDSGVSRLGAASLAIGNGTAGDTTGTLTVKHLNVIDATSDNALSLVGTDNGTNLLSFNLTSAPTTSVVAAYLHTNCLAWYTTSESFAILSNGHGVGVNSTGVYGWGSSIPSAGLDTGISRLGAASLAIGNGTAGDFTGSLKLTTLTLQGKVGTYNAVATVSNGVPSELATVDLTAQSAAIAATTLYAVPAAGAGMYRITWVATITTKDAASSALGGTNGFQISFTSPTDSVVKTDSPTTPIISAANTTGTSISGCEVVYAKASTNIQYAFGYTSNTPGQMVFELHIKCEAM